MLYDKTWPPLDASSVIPGWIPIEFKCDSSLRLFLRPEPPVSDKKLRYSTKSSK